MDSPETTLLGPSAAQADVVSPSGVQESPFFTYVSNLSPIKLTNDLRAPSTIRELNFPSPTPVFTSPHVNPVRKEKLLKRPQHLSPDSGKFSLDCVGDIREQLEKASHYGGDTSQSVFAPCSANTVRGQPAIQLQSCSSPSDCIDDFLADPAEDSGNSSAMSNLCLSKIVGLGLPSQKTPTDVTDQCQEGSTSLLILSQQGDKTTDDIKTEAGKNDGPNDIGLLMLESQARENDEASMQLIRISGHDGDLKDASDNGGENKERQSAQNVTSDDSSLHVVQQIDTQTTNYVCSMMPENVEDDSLVNKNEVSILPLDSSIFDGNVDLVERDQSLRVPPNSLDVHPNEEASTSSKPQWGGGQFAYAMRRRLEFVHSSAPSSNPYSGRDSYNLRPESPSSSLDLELEIVSHSYPIGAYASPDTSLYKTNVDSSSHASSQLPVCMEGNLTRSESSVRKRPAGIGLHLNSIGNAPDKNSKLSGQPVDRELVKESSAVPFQMREHCNTDQNVNTLPQPDVYSESAIVGSSIEKVEEDQHKNLDITVMSSLPMETVSQLSAPCSVKRSPGELIDISPKKKSKKAPESGGCKRCNCKKSKCLKLYCDCFAAGVYCTDSCSCQGCLNRLEHEHIVMETRQQIEIRNPLAFAPKVVVHDTAVVSRSYGDAESHTPASARHKRGCNCKKSQCLKKYCECFQSKVGCSLGCRCEGCKNSYGMKDGPASSENEIIRKSWNEKQGRGAYVIADEADAGNEFPRSAKPLHLSPLTPLVDGSDGINPSKSQFLYRKYHSSPESAASRERNNAHDEADIEATDVFSPRWDRIGEIFILSPGATHGAVKVNSQSGPRGSPMTPSLPFGITRFAQESSSDCGPVNAYENDGTPDILLRDNCLPCQGPKVGSPNKKRVSPPHHHCQQDDRTSSSSRSMKSRKFVLQSVPSFPSLTPYSNVAKGQGL